MQVDEERDNRAAESVQVCYAHDATRVATISGKLWK